MKKVKKGLENCVALYMRYSSENQSEHSIIYQREKLQEFCKERNYTIQEEYVDEAKSATTANRASFQKMIYDAHNSPSWSKIIVYDFSRFSRNMYDSACRFVLREHGINLISATEPIAEGPTGDLMENIIFSFSDFYSKNNGKSTFDSIVVNAKKNFHCGGVPPLGFDVGADKRLVVNQEEAQIVRKIFNMYEFGYSYKEMAEALNKKGYLTKKNKPFTKNSFITILRQEKYTGTYTWNKRKTKTTSTGKRHIPKPEEEHIINEDGCPQIISKQQFTRVQEMLNSDISTVNKSFTKHHYMLSGLKIIKCELCGSYMIGKYVTSHGHGYVTYSCPKHKTHECPMTDIKAEYLDSVVAEELAGQLCQCNLEKLSAVMKGGKAYTTAKKKLNGLDTKTSNIMNALANGVPSELVVEKLKELYRQKQAVKETIDEFENDNTSINDDNVHEYIESFKDILINSDDVEIKEYIKSKVTSITVGKEEVKFEIA